MTTRVTEAVETVSITAGKGAVVIGSGTSAIATFVHANFVGICGLAIAVIGYFTSAYFQKRRDAREQERHELDRRLMERQIEKLSSRPAPLE